MARMTAKERELLDALAKRAKDEESEDSEHEITVTLDNGHKITYRGAKARAYERKHGLADDDGDEEATEEEATEEEADKKPVGGGYFKTRK